MKKTIVAAAIAAVVAAPAAMAELKISGQINQEFGDDGADLEQNLNVDIKFSGSEDLGNGMKAGFVVAMVADNAASGELGESSSGANDGEHKASDQYLTLSGDFGSVQVGTFEPYTESAVVALAANDAADAISIETALGNEGREEGGIRYTSPAMNGFKVGLEGFAQNQTTGNDFGTTAIFAEYSNGPLLVRVADEDGTDASGDDITTFAAQYKMGDLTVRAVYSDNDTDSTDETFVGAAYKMGNNEIAVATIADATASLGTDGDYTLSFKHNMSKTTAVYVATKNDDDGSDTTLVGMQMKF